MKKLILLLSIIALFCQSTFAQTGGLNFQGIARNASGAVLANQKVNLKFSILKTTETGDVEYTETKETTTNAQGIFAVVVGEVNASSFAAIDWKQAPKFLKVEMDPAGGTSFVSMGTTRLQNVPFAYYANGVNANNIDGSISVAKGGTGAADAAAARTNLGLGNADNTSDAAKPISAATKVALDLKANAADLAAFRAITVDTTMLATKAALLASNYAPINSPSFTGTVMGISKNMVGLGSVDNTTDAAKPISTLTQTALDLKAPLASPTFTGTVSGITKAMVGLGLVDNTTDAAKPISAATQTALDLKASTSDLNNALTLKANVTALNLKAPIASPTFTGNVEAAGYKIANGTATQYLMADGTVSSGGGSIIPNLANSVTGTLPVANGGTGLTSVGTSGQVLSTTGSGTLTWTTPSSSQWITASNNIYYNAGRVGIGTSTPSYITDIVGTGGPRLRVYSQDNLYAGILTQNSTGQFFAGIQAVGESGNGTTSGYHIYDNTRGARRMVIDYNGNMGIGESNPSEKLVVSGNIKSSGTVIAGAVTYPNTHGTSGQVLSTIGSGTLTWTTPASGTAVTVGTISSTSTTNGASITAGVLNLAPANATNGGVVTTGTQTFAGAKTFNSDIIVNGLTIGLGAGQTNNQNITIGSNALANNTGGQILLALGNSALQNNTTADYNIGIGAAAVSANSTGMNNVGLGVASLASNNGSNNTAIGRSTLLLASAIDDATSLGYKAGYNNNGSFNTFLGSNTDQITSNSSVTNATAIGYNAKVDASNTIQLGNTSLANVKTSGTITAGDVTYPKAHGTFGQVLSTTGSGTLTWTTASGGSSLPSQTGNFGKFLSSDGMNAAWSNITLPTASSMTLGGIKVGTGLSMDMMTGALKVNTGSGLTTDMMMGTLKVNTGSGLTTDMMTGAIKVNTGSNFTTDMMTGALKVNTGSGLTSDMMTGALSLNTASSMTLGGVKVGAGLNIDMDGVLSTSSAAPSGKKFITTVVGPINTSNYSSGDIVYDQSSGNFYLFKSSIPNQNSVGFNNANTSFGSFVSGGRPVVIKIRPSVSGFITSISLDVGNATDAVFSLYSGLEVCSSVATVNASTLMGTSSANSGTGIINFTFPTPIAVNAYSDYYLTVSSSDSSVAYIRVRTGGSDSNFAISYGGCDINQGSPGVQITYGPYITL